MATKDVLVTAFTDIGIEAITGGKKAFVNFTKDLLLNETPMLVSNNVLIVELLENIEPSPEVIQACKRLKDRGYLIALDDFIYCEEMNPILELADIVKVDFLNNSEEDIRLNFKKIRSRYKKVLLAEKVETYESVEFAKSLGCTLFQGFFYCKPRITHAKNIDTQRISKLLLLRSISNPDVSFLELAEIIKRDVVLSYRLLNIVNSAYYGLNYTVTGILHALTILGLNEIKKWISFILISEYKDNKPNELIRAALIRSMFMEKLAVIMKDRKHKDEYFMVGLFSLAEAIMDSPIDAILNQAHLSKNINDTLLTGQGKIGELLQIIVNIEKANWEEADFYMAKYKLSMQKVNKCYIEAMKDTNKIMR
jgi:EAL and modified HD-GYP domain-containing signal transduction protein